MTPRFVCVDFDGTIVTHEYPLIGDPVPGAIDTLKELQSEGHYLILFTMRSGERLHEAVQYLRSHNIKLYGVNENRSQISWTKSPKVYGHIYIDDAAAGCPLIYKPGIRPYVNWSKIDDELVDKGFLKP